jgi:hypothetical protein
MAGCFAFLAVLLLIGGTIWSISQSLEQQKRDEQEEAAHHARKEAERQRDRAEQEHLRLEMSALSSKSIEALETTPRRIEAAEHYLDLAERNFADGAFAPFWDSVEKTAAALGAVQESVKLIDHNAGKYAELAKRYRGNVERFAVSESSPHKLKVAAATSARMNDIVRQAQRNFQFSVIYEQRKTNQILVAGFRSLAQALEEMTWRITSSVDGLSESIVGMRAALTDSLREIQSNTTKLASAAETNARAAPARLEREEKVLEMLDNIQRERHPSILHGGLR